MLTRCCKRNSWTEPRSELRRHLEVQDETGVELREFRTLGFHKLVRIEGIPQLELTNMSLGQESKIAN